jgi:hypothetical protein
MNWAVKYLKATNNPERKSKHQERTKVKKTSLFTIYANISFRQAFNDDKPNITKIGVHARKYDNNYDGLLKKRGKTGWWCGLTRRWRDFSRFPRVNSAEHHQSEVNWKWLFKFSSVIFDNWRAVIWNRIFNWVSS